MSENTDGDGDGLGCTCGLGVLDADGTNDACALFDESGLSVGDKVKLDKLTEGDGDADTLELIVG